MIDAYLGLHRLGHAHSVETWIGGKLAGGLYGVAMGRVFFGESMFSRARRLQDSALGSGCAPDICRFGLIDCQMHTRHLETLAPARFRGQGFPLLEELIHYPRTPGTWSGASFAQVQCPS